ncbi:MAG TPA: hypothetical protein P5280_02450 [Cyclobacteriaceae bacterium]|nr:hypothetical protein [Cyclobacteriaceae bacterium]
MSKDFSNLLGGALANKSADELKVRERIVIRDDFKSLIPPLAQDELEQLESNILNEGVRDPLIIWPVGDTFVLVDGHNRFFVCQKHGLDFPFKKVDFKNDEDVRDWMVKNQLGRRNLSQEQQSYLRGLRYNREKSQGKRTDLTSDQNDLKSSSTSQLLASEYNVSEATIKRDGEFAAGVEAIAKGNPELKKSILLGKSKLTKQEVRLIGKGKATKPKNKSLKRTYTASEISGIAFNYINVERRPIETIMSIIGFNQSEDSAIEFFTKWNESIKNQNK